MKALPARLILLMATCAQAAQEPEAFLRKHAQFSARQVEAFLRGEPVALILDSAHPTEIPPFAAVRVAMSTPFFMEKYRDIATFKKSKEVLQIGKFSRPPRLEDLAALTLDEGEVDSLEGCKAGDCKFKLTDGMIRRLQAEMRWNAPDRTARASLIFRQLLLEHLHAYLEKGNAALPAYHDRKNPLRSEEEFRSLMEASPYLKEYVPALGRYLVEFPNFPCEEAEDFFYWSKEKFGYKPVVSLTHVVMYRHRQPQADAVVIASKQLFANHYFQASLGLSAFAELKAGGAQPGGYLFYLNRSRSDIPRGLFGGIVRYFIKRRVLDGLEKYLVLIRRRMEAEFVASRPR